MELDSKIVFKYLMKDCSNEEYTIIKEWLNKDSKNQHWLFELESLWNDTRFADYSEPEYIQSQFEKTLHKINQPSRIKRKRILFTTFQKYAAVLALCLLVGTSIFLMNERILTKSSKNIAFFTETVSSKGDVKEIILPDKSKVWLNSGSTLTYSENFNKSERRIKLTGEAFFQVAHDSTKPFRVETGLFTVKVLGTSFNVHTDTKMTDATLVEGKVVIEDEREREILVLSPGQKVESNTASGRLQVMNVNTELNTAWIHGYIAFENATITEIIQKLEDLYSQKIEILPSTNIERTYTGSVLKEKKVEQVLKSLQNTIPIDYKYDGKTIMVLKHK